MQARTAVSTMEGDGKKEDGKATHKAITMKKIDGKPGQVWYPYGRHPSLITLPELISSMYIAAYKSSPLLQPHPYNQITYSFVLHTSP